RGEIACRVATTARRLGVRTVAVYSDADADARHVSVCDEAVRLGPAPARESYLRGELILAAAKATGAEAIHPGYGFLSENEDFALACAQAGIAFIGPPASAIRAMGSKSEAKALMEKAGVPLVPGYHGAEQDAAFLRREADRIGYPVLIKASAGGGGKGMRIVRASDEFEAALASCKREAASSFGDDRVLVEKYLERPRHIEIQVFADAHGGCVSLFERDCSVQRRHQKVIEEAPAPGMTAERRRAMGEAAVAAARAVHYQGAGTVEFIAGPDGTFYFMEMNTRLQVEHPVTEMITGHDLVEWQLRVACGESLPATQDELSIRGHAIEARIYAENPDKGFLPAIGRLSHFAQPAAVQFVRNAGQDRQAEPAAVRIDAGVRAGDAISATRDQALARMRAALADTHIVGLATNVDFLARLMSNPSFARAQLDTGLIERERAALFPSQSRVPHEVLALAVARVVADEAAASLRDGVDPWASRHGWRLNTLYTRTLTFKSQMGEHVGVHDVLLHYTRDGFVFEHDGVRASLAIDAVADARTDTRTDTRLSLRLGDRRLAADVARDAATGEDLHVFLAGRHVMLTLVDVIAHAGEGDAAEGRMTAPMPGKVIAVNVARGAQVRKGAALLVMEAMKMEHTIVAPADGVVEEILFGVGDQVAEGAALVAFAAA
ncbi:MAG: ATP-grasp domain-containing protein, partial [Burkholderiaceae bacterium]|nr:ATP-grasp domain-containing protein [Burkholderiaceae bacterium]